MNLKFCVCYFWIQLLTILWQATCDGMDKRVIEPILTLNAEYSNRFGFIINPRYANAINLSNAMGLEIAFNPREYRMEATWVHQLTQHQRLKMTGEYLAQVLSVMFVTGETAVWTDQRALAFLYEYTLSNPWLSDLHVQSYYLHSHDEHLLSWPYNLNYVEYTDHRNIAGSRNAGVAIGLDSYCSPRVWIGADLFYDAMHFNHYYEEPPPSGLGIAGSIETIISACVKAKVSMTERPVYQQVHADIKWLLQSRPGSQLELVLGWDYFKQPFIIKNESLFGLQLIYHWNNNCRVDNYLSPIPNKADNIRWASQPVIRFPQTMVIRDESIVVN